LFLGAKGLPEEREQQQPPQVKVGALGKVQRQEEDAHQQHIQDAHAVAQPFAVDDRLAQHLLRGSLL
jgi:hypothetical protein